LISMSLLSFNILQRLDQIQPDIKWFFDRPDGHGVNQDLCSRSIFQWGLDRIAQKSETMTE